MFIDLAEPPYNVVADWSRNDALATDNYAAIQAAALTLAPVAGQSPDWGQAEGGVLLLPRGSTMISDGLVLPPGVSMRGHGQYGSFLVLKEGGAIGKPVIDLGDRITHRPAFGSQLRDFSIWTSPNDSEQYAQDCAVVYTENAQDTDGILRNMRIYGMNRRCFVGTIGWGGASIINMYQVTGNSSLQAPAFTFDYGESSMVYVEGLEPSGSRKNPDPSHPEYNVPKPGTIGAYFRGGYGQFKRFHIENADWGLAISLKTGKCFCDVEFATGGPCNNSVIVIHNNPTQLGRIRLTNVERNGAIQNTVTNGQSGAPAIYTEIRDATIF